MKDLKSRNFKTIFIILAISLTVGCTSTGDDDNTTTNLHQGQQNNSNPGTCTEIKSTTFNVDTTLDGCYKINRSITVAKNKLLTIKPGSVLIFTSSGYISVDGALKAVGTPTKPILFTGTTKAAGHWQGIQFNNAVDDRNELANIVIEYAGSWNYGALYASGATKLKIRDSIIRNNKLYGFYFGNNVVLNEFHNVTSTKNEKTAGSVHPNALNVIDGTSDFTGNSNDYLTVRSGTINSNQTWSALSVPVLVDRYVEVPQNKLLTIKPGAKFKFTSNGYMSVNGALKAVGKSNKRILFSGATASKGFWQCIQFNNAVDNRNELGYVTVEYAGSWSYGAIYASDATVLNIHDSIIRHNNLFGLWISGTARVTNTNNIFSDNTDGDIHQD